MIAKRRRGRPDIEKEIQRGRHIYKLDWTPLGTFGPQFGG